MSEDSISTGRWALLVGGACLTVFATVLSLASGWRPANPLAPDLDGAWVLVEGTVDGKEISGNEMVIDTEAGGHEAFTGSLMCNTFTGDAWDNLFQTVVGCFSNGGSPEQMGDEPQSPPGRWPEQSMFFALREGPSLEGDQLVFEIDGVRLVYERLGA